MTTTASPQFPVAPSRGPTSLTRAPLAKWLLATVLLATGLSSAVGCEHFPSSRPRGEAPKTEGEPSESSQTGSPGTTGSSVPSAWAARPARERIIDFYTIGGGSTNLQRRQVGYVNERGGWRTFVDTHMRRSYEWGARRIWLHCPFGNTPSKRFDLDQYQLAEEAGLTWLTQGFTEAWAPIVAGAFGERVEVVAYVGTVSNRRARGSTPGFDRHADAGRADLWMERALDSVRPALAAGMSIGFDAATNQPDEPPDNWSFAFASLLRSLGVRVYVEPRPQREFPGWHDFHVLCVDSFWRRSDPARHRDSAWAATNEQLTGEIVRLVVLPVGVEGNQARIDETAEHVREILRAGHTVAINLKVFREGNWSLERLVRGLDASRETSQATSQATSPAPSSAGSSAPSSAGSSLGTPSR